MAKEIEKDGVYRIKGTHNYIQYRKGHVLGDDEFDQVEYVSEFGKPVPASAAGKADVEAENKAAAKPENKSA